MITNPPIPTPTCKHLEADPDKGRDVGGCICDSSITLPVLTSNQPKDATNIDEQLCGYTSLPTSGDATVNPVTTESHVWTSNCQVCTWIGEFAGSKTCTSVKKRCTPTPTATATPTVIAKPWVAAWVANLSTIDIGNAADKNNGTDLAKDMFNKLSSFCSDTGCDPGQKATIDNAEAIVDEGDIVIKPVLYFQDAQYENITVFQQMLSIGLSTWVSAMNDPGLKLCNEVEYKAEEDPTGSGCGSGPIQPERLVRIVRRHDGEVLWARDELEERCFDSCGGGGNGGVPVCTYKAKMCNAPNEITAVAPNADNAYGNRLNIGVDIEQQDAGAGFDCEAIVELLTTAAIALAPELIPVDVLEGVEVESVCGVIDNIESVVGSLTAMVPAPTQ
ncbi:hypothetical protein F5B20DRAFT_582157 [Whalleya microplaca]|nr:hypothetical protein F5B20DRAFT_582157 [Whalleya microplaca]